MRACKICHRLTEDKECPVCKTKELTENWQGIVVIFNPEKSEIAKELGFLESGKYAIKV
ncbi:MAG: DNA-directed RNA polymerase subunit E'' [Candidatus Aenigmarchaeota archaeon ex4484_56]|nr:MAG: DNA-directed RNA polymerase subunit E'' [Candidatus Aenigmarchaeota archaeon ex4484_56]